MYLLKASFQQLHNYHYRRYLRFTMMKGLNAKLKLCLAFTCGLMITLCIIDDNFHEVLPLNSLKMPRPFTIKSADRIPNLCFKLVKNSSDFNKIVDTSYSLPDRHCHFITNGMGIGRLGNQMFQVAALVGIAYAQDMIPAINIRHLTIGKYFEFPNTIKTDIEKVIVCEEHGMTNFTVCPNSNSSNILMKGVRQSWKYSSGVENYIRKVFVLKEKYMKEARSFMTINSKPSHKNVCIHVRRGDMLFKELQKRGYGVPGMDYFSKAMQFYRSNFKAVHFIVLSNDRRWCRDNFKEDVTFSPYIDPGIDMAIMSMCDHMIISSGTFGWWGAWLSNGTVVYYKDFPTKGSNLDRIMFKEEYYPPHWIAM